MRTLLFCLLFCYNLKTSAQSSISIEYVKVQMVLTDSLLEAFLKDPGPADIRMVINDSFSLSYFLVDYNKNLYKKAVIGNKLIHHAEFSNYITNETFSESDWPKNRQYLIKHDSSRIKKWQPFEGEKIILGYRCKAVRSVNKNHATTTVWYTNEMKFKRGDLFYPGVPGVVLEAIDYGWGATGAYIRAVSIKDSKQILVAPENKKVVTFNEIK